MRIANNWKDYQLLDATCGERLEKWGSLTVIRPDPQVIWRTAQGFSWKNADMHYYRSEKGGGEWQKATGTRNQSEIQAGVNFKEIITYSEVLKNNCNDYKFVVKPTDFKHMGLFPEQAVNWEYCNDVVGLNILNLFAYTGAMSVVLAKKGANVTHVDASKGIVNWAKENAEINGISNIRFIVDDCKKFVEKEIRRGKKYDIIIMDPPSYGRGSNGEVWKFEDNIYEFLILCKQIISENPRFIMLNSYTTGISPSTVAHCVETAFNERKYGKENQLGLQKSSVSHGQVTYDEIGLKIETGGVLPCGSTVIWSPKATS
ncbi:SAM-dependent methyltransferase [Clostridia bacterium]|nr:SAM-dependent methyltransferase [Clostridia bacterium]